MHTHTHTLDIPARSIASKAIELTQRMHEYKLHFMQKRKRKGKQQLAAKLLIASPIRFGYRCCLFNNGNMSVIHNIYFFTNSSIHNNDSHGSVLIHKRVCLWSRCMSLFFRVLNILACLSVCIDFAMAIQSEHYLCQHLFCYII